MPRFEIRFATQGESSHSPPEGRGACTPDAGRANLPPQAEYLSLMKNFAPPDQMLLVVKLMLGVERLGC